MKATFWLALAAVIAMPAFSKDFEKQSDPQVFEKSFEAMHYIEHAFEIGRSNFNISVTCLKSAKEVEKAIEDVVSKIQGKVDTAGSDLSLGEKGETFGYEMASKVQAYAQSPIQPPSPQNKWRWVNTCTGVASDVPVRVPYVYAGNKSISIWFPNKADVLNHLSALATEIEELSDKSTQGVKIQCQSSSGTNYDLAVTRETEKKIWAEVEAVAKKRATAKASKELNATGYDNAWKGREEFVANGQTRLPNPQVVKEDGKWLAKFSDSRVYNVRVHQASSTKTQPGHLAGYRSYPVTANATSTSGLYGELSVVVTKGCNKTRPDGEKEVSTVGNTILTDMRAINGKSNDEMNRLKIQNAYAKEYNPWVLYQYKGQDGASTNSYYNSCTLETKTGVDVPLETVYQGQMSLTIRSSNLDKLASFRDDLAKKYNTTLEDPNQIQVNTTWQATAILAVLEDLASQLETDSMQKFLDDKSEFRCQAGDLSFACISSRGSSFNPAPGGRGAFDRSDAKAVSEESAGSYSEGVTSDIDAGERGVATFRGKYVINYTLRKVLIDNKRE